MYSILFKPLAIASLATTCLAQGTSIVNAQGSAGIIAQQATTLLTGNPLAGAAIVTALRTESDALGVANTLITRSGALSVDCSAANGQFTQFTTADLTAQAALLLVVCNNALDAGDARDTIAGLLRQLQTNYNALGTSLATFCPLYAAGIVAAGATHDTSLTANIAAFQAPCLV